MEKYIKLWYFQNKSMRTQAFLEQKEKIEIHPDYALEKRNMNPLEEILSQNWI